MLGATQCFTCTNVISVNSSSEEFLCPSYVTEVNQCHRHCKELASGPTAKKQHSKRLNSGGRPLQLNRKNPTAK